MWASIKKRIYMNDHLLPQMDFDMRELRAILSIFQAYLKQSRLSIGLLSNKQQAKERKRVVLVDSIRRTLERQIQAGDVHFVLTLEELKAVIKSLKVYMYYVSMFPRTDERDKALTITFAWLERFNTFLPSLQSP